MTLLMLSATICTIPTRFTTRNTRRLTLEQTPIKTRGMPLNYTVRASITSKQGSHTTGQQTTEGFEMVECLYCKIEIPKGDISTCQRLLLVGEKRERVAHRTCFVEANKGEIEQICGSLTIPSLK
jgi:hypothetical protein